MQLEVFEMIYRPMYVEKIMAYTDTPFVKILTGVRRCGKSTILKMIMEKLRIEKGIPEERIVSYRFDSMEYEDMTAKEMYAELKGRISTEGRTYLFLDEMQEIDGWEKVVNSLATDYDVDLYVTGSNSRMMSSEISTYLTGRYVAFQIYTLSFREYLTFKKQYAKLEIPGIELANYIRRGGFPAAHLQDYEYDEIYTIVRDIYNSTVFSDIVKRNQIRKIDQLERVVKYTFNNVGNTFSAKTISNYLKAERRSLDNETVYSYLEKLEKAYLLYRCSRYDLQGKERLRKNIIWQIHPFDTVFWDTMKILLPLALKMWFIWNCVAEDILCTLGKRTTEKLTLLLFVKMKNYIFRLRSELYRKRLKNENMNVCLKFVITIQNMYCGRTSLPVGILRELKPCM